MNCCDDLIESLKTLLEAEGEAAIQRDRDGYLGRWMGERLESARGSFMESLTKHIDDRIEAATGARP